MPERVYCISRDPLRHFATAIKAIQHDGPIPQDEQIRIAERAIGAARSYILRLVVKRNNPPPGEQRQIWEKVAASSGQLLKALGIDDPAYLARGLPDGMPGGLGLLFPSDLHSIAVERRGSTETMAVEDPF